MTRMQAQLDAASRPVAAVVVKPNIPNLPRLGPESSIDPFVSTFEAQLRLARIKEDQWKLLLIGQLDEVHRERLAESITDVDSSYEDLVVRLGRLDTDQCVSYRVVF